MLSAYQHSGFFVLRTPLKPFAYFRALSKNGRADPLATDAKSWVECRAQARQALADLAANSEMRAAVRVSSPSLYERMNRISEAPGSKKSNKLEHALYSYVARMSTRPTPFGLMAACSIGEINGSRSMQMCAAGSVRRYTRLDMQLLSELSDKFRADRDAMFGIEVRPNSTLFGIGDRLHYTQRLTTRLGCDFQLCSVIRDDYLQFCIDGSRRGITPAELVTALCGLDKEIDREEAQAYVVELLDAQVLVSQLDPNLIGTDPLQRLVSLLKIYPETKAWAASLNAIQSGLKAMDGHSVCVPEAQYAAFESQLGKLAESVSVKIRPSRLYQVDCMRAMRSCSLSEFDIEEVRRAMQILIVSTNLNKQRPLDRFRTSFTDRYADRMVPLLEVLDDEIGVGFEGGGWEAMEPLLQGIVLQAKEPGAIGNSAPPVAADQIHLLESALASGAQEVVVDAEDCLQRSCDHILPDAFHAMVTIRARSEAAFVAGDYQLLIDHVAGPSGVNLLGRFCYMDPDMTARVRAHIKAEELLRPDAVYAELVHAPSARMGNLIFRPQLRAHELIYLGCSGSESAQRIDIGELLIGVRNHKLVLYSQRLDKQVIPRLTSAHNLSMASNSRVYKFLGLMQQEGLTCNGFQWVWRGLQAASFLPRVRAGKVILSRARWLLNKKNEPELYSVQGAEFYAALQTWRETRHAPRWLCLAEGDQELALDLDNTLSVEVLEAHMRKHALRSIKLTEPLAGPGDLWLGGDDQPFVNQLIIPFVRSPEA